MKFLEWPYRKYIKTVKMAACSEDFRYGNDFDAILAIFCSYRYDANATEGVKMIATDEKFFLCVRICIATAYQ